MTSLWQWAVHTETCTKRNSDTSRFLDFPNRRHGCGHVSYQNRGRIDRQRLFAEQFLALQIGGEQRVCGRQQ